MPGHAKKAAKMALKQRKEFSDPPGLSVKEAKKLGINSGVARARQLVKSNTISVEDAKRIAAFYDRFKNRDSPRSEVAIKLWGGRRFGRSLAAKF